MWLSRSRLSLHMLRSAHSGRSPKLGGKWYHLHIFVKKRKKSFVFVLCREAAEAAGFHVLRLIHEPAAALLAYNIGQDSSSGKRYSTEQVKEQPVSHLMLYSVWSFPLTLVCTVLTVTSWSTSWAGRPWVWPCCRSTEGCSVFSAPTLTTASEERALPRP